MNDYFKYIIIDHYAIALQYWWMFTNCAEIWFSRVGFFAQVVKYQLYPRALFIFHQHLLKIRKRGSSRTLGIKRVLNQLWEYTRAATVQIVFGSVLIFVVGFRFGSSNCILFVFHIQNMFSYCKLYFFNDKHKTITKWRLENRNVPRRAT